LSVNSRADEIAQTIIQVMNERKPQSVQQLTALVRERLFATEEKILESILKLQSQGKIKLESQPLPASLKLASYLRTSQALWYWATMAVATITVVIVFTVPEEFYPWSYLRNVLGILFVLWLPGYASIKALFPVRMPIQTSAESLETIERLALSIGMSIALVPMIGLLLYYTPLGLSLTPIVLSMLALTVVLATVAIAREHQTKTKTQAYSTAKS
jgi:uncharacterized membrane protein